MAKRTVTRATYNAHYEEAVEAALEAGVGPEDNFDGFVNDWIEEHYGVPKDGLDERVTYAIAEVAVEAEQQQAIPTTVHQARLRELEMRVALRAQRTIDPKWDNKMAYLNRVNNATQAVFEAAIVKQAIIKAEVEEAAIIQQVIDNLHTEHQARVNRIYDEIQVDMYHDYRQR